MIDQHVLMYKQTTEQGRSLDQLSRSRPITSFFQEEKQFHYCQCVTTKCWEPDVNVYKTIVKPQSTNSSINRDNVFKAACPLPKEVPYPLLIEAIDCACKRYIFSQSGEDGNPHNYDHSTLHCGYYAWMIQTSLDWAVSWGISLSKNCSLERLRWEGGRLTRTRWDRCQVARVAPWGSEPGSRSWSDHNHKIKIMSTIIRSRSWSQP